MDENTTPRDGMPAGSAPEPGARRALPPLDDTPPADVYEPPTEPMGARGVDDPDRTRPVNTNDDDTTDGQGQPRILGGRYRLEGVIGRGGMAQVFRAQDTRLGRPVAVKELRADLANDPTFQARFRREAQSAAGLNHPNIVSVYDTGESIDPGSGLGVPWIVMELVEGHTLREILREGRKILPERALELTQGVLDALSYSHRAGIVHRDIKAANVMLTPSGQVKVMDFGIARAVADTQATITQTAAVIGTAQYLSPEQARGEAVDNRSDIYSAGCLLYELLIGRPPFVGDSPLSVAYQHVREQPVPPSHLDEMITPEIDAITLKALAKDPADRYQDARDMRDDISRLLHGEEVTASLPVAPRTAVTPAPAPLEEDEELEEEPEEKKKKTGLVIGILATIAVLALIAGGLWFWFRPTEPEVVMVPVPRVLGEQRTSAENTMRNAGFKPEIVEDAGPDDQTVGTVTEQEPADGQTAPQGSTVTLTVNVGPEKIQIPGDLVGKPRSEVEQKLRDAGFTNVTSRVSEEETGDREADEVLSVDPSNGSFVPDTEITVIYASGKSTVPDWVGWNRESVESDAEAKGFTAVNFTEESVTDPNRVGQVLRTDPSAGAKVSSDTTITVVIGKQAPTPTPTESQTPLPTATPSGAPSPGGGQPTYPGGHGNHGHRR